ncbi:hypothetical protein RN001_002720 [Aquatica leii]|uniref:ETS domain-containing protein n=1 Tax=Aquatica leii TaxID=1421715 RepID=A0AAN7PH97_9COLE|nr:hypothetical protein RN001_002720 [Aquatica leii]
MSYKINEQSQLDCNLFDGNSSDWFDINETIKNFISDNKFLNEQQVLDNLLSDMAITKPENTSTGNMVSEQLQPYTYFDQCSTSSEQSLPNNRCFVPSTKTEQESIFFSDDSNSYITNPESFYNSHSSSLSRNNNTNGKRGRPKLNICRKNKKQKLGRIWEFLRDLLSNRDTCPSLIKWDDFKKGTFEFVKTEQVAKIWGKRNDNKTMNFEKFSRAMRYHYKSETLLSVEKKRLVYQFGPKAQGWRTSCPILD